MQYLKSIVPKLPMKDLEATKKFYLEKLDFSFVNEYAPDYLILQKDAIEIHFFLFKELIMEENYGMCYIRVENIAALYDLYLKKGVEIHPSGHLTNKPWGQIEFSILDNNINLLTFGESNELK